MFPTILKQKIEENLHLAVQGALDNHPDFKSRINIEPLRYILDDEVFNLPEIQDFIANNHDKIIKINQTCLLPLGLHIDDGSSIRIFEHIINDFYCYLVNLVAATNNVDVQVELNKFETEFFAETKQVQFISELKHIYNHSGGEIENTPRGTKVRYAKDMYELRLIGWGFNDQSYSAFFRDFFQQPILALSSSKDTQNRKNAYTLMNEAVNEFNLICMVIRAISGGSAFFDAIRVISIGNYSPAESWNTKHVTENNVFNHMIEYTTIENSDDWIASSVFKNIINQNYEDFVFVDWQLRNTHLPEYTGDEILSTREKEFALIQKTIDLTTALNALLPDIDNRRNKVLREAYFTKFIQPFSGGLNLPVIESIVKGMYSVRGEAVHGKYSIARSEMYNNFNSVDTFKNRLLTFEKIIMRLMLLHLANIDLKTTLQNWFNNGVGDPNTLPTINSPFQA